MYRAKYFPGLFARYEKKGRAWIKALPPEDLQVFIRLGFQCSDYGRKGGKALLEKYGREYFRQLAQKRIKANE